MTLRYRITGGGRLAQPTGIPCASWWYALGSKPRAIPCGPPLCKARPAPNLRNRRSYDNAIRWRDFSVMFNGVTERVGGGMKCTHFAPPLTPLSASVCPPGGPRTGACPGQNAGPTRYGNGFRPQGYTDGSPRCVTLKRDDHRTRIDAIVCGLASRTKSPPRCAESPTSQSTTPIHLVLPSYLCMSPVVNPAAGPRWPGAYRAVAL